MGEKSCRWPLNPSKQRSVVSTKHRRHSEVCSTHPHIYTHTIMGELKGSGGAARAGVDAVVAVCASSSDEAHVANLNLGLRLGSRGLRSSTAVCGRGGRCAGRELDNCSCAYVYVNVMYCEGARAGECMHYRWIAHVGLWAPWCMRRERSTRFPAVESRPE